MLYDENDRDMPEMEIDDVDIGIEDEFNDKQGFYQGQYMPNYQGQYVPEMTRPPSYMPHKPSGHSDLNMIRRCMNRLGYMWLYNGRNFWVRITRIQLRTVQGYSWNGRRWVNFSVDNRQIEAFICVRTREE
jgi:hypothetical protein